MRASKSRIFLWLFEDDAWYLSANHQLSKQNQSYCEIIFDHIQPIQFAGLTIATSGGTLLQLKQSLKSQIKFGILKTNEQMNCSFRLFEIIQKFALKCSLFSAKFSRNLFALITVFYKRTELKKYTLGTEELHCVDVKGWQELTLMGRNKDKNFLCFLSCSRARAKRLVLTETTMLWRTHICQFFNISKLLSRTKTWLCVVSITLLFLRSLSIALVYTRPYVHFSTAFA